MTPHPERRTRLRAVLALLVVTVIWGWTFVWMRGALGASKARIGSDGAAPIALFIALRFGLGALVLACVPVARRGLTREVWAGGLVLGGLLLGGFLLQMQGLRDVSAAVSAFLTSLYVLFTALLGALLQRRVPGLAVLAGALLASFGAGFIQGPPQVTFGLGEWLTIACALLFALHILATDRWTKRAAPMPLTLTSFVVVAAGAAVALGLALQRDPSVGASELRALLADASFRTPLIYSSLFATVLAISLMNLYQRELDPLRAAILYALEPVWCALIAIASGQEEGSGWLWVGGAALLAGNLVAELGQRPAASAAPAAERPS